MVLIFFIPPVLHHAWTHIICLCVLLTQAIDISSYQYNGLIANIAGFTFAHKHSDVSLAKGVLTQMTWLPLMLTIICISELDVLHLVSDF